MIETQLPALQVVLPLLGAAFCALARRGRPAWGIAMAVSAAMPFISGAMLLQVVASGPISYALGGWAPPYGIEYRVDALSGVVLLLVSVMAAIMLPFARASIAHEIGGDREGWFYCMFLLCLAGLLGITITGDAFNAFVFLEISSLATYAMVALGRDRRALLAAYQYLILGTLGAAFYVIGIGFLYAMTGTLNLADLADRLGDVIQSRSAIAALAFITVGLSLKLALFPLHVWLPAAYAYAPSFVTAFLAATATKVAAYLLLRFLYLVFGATFIVEGLPVPALIILLSLAGLFGASIVAIFQDNVKLMLAYSSVAQIGLIVLGLGIANEAGLTGSVVHLLNHAFMKGAMFLAVGIVAYQLGSVQLKAFAGLGRTMPLTMTALTIGGLSMVGIPGTVGFISKWYLAVGALERDWWWLLALIVASSLLSLVYVGRLLEVVWLRQPEGSSPAREPPLSMLLPTVALAGLCVFFGLDTELTVGLARGAADLLIGGLR